MSRTGWILKEGSPWRLIRVNGEQVRNFALSAPLAVSPQALAAEVREVLAGEKAKDCQLLLALESTSYLVTLLDSPGTHRPSDRELSYLLETQLPVSAEDLVADFHRRENGYFAIALVAHPWKPLLDSLGEVGIEIPWIVPWALLAEQHLARETSHEADTLHLWPGTQWMDAIFRQEAEVRDWTVLPPDPPSLNRHLRGLALNVGTPRCVVFHGRCPTALADWQPESGIERIESVETDRNTAAMAAAGKILGGYQSAPVNLRCGLLQNPRRFRSIRTPLTALVASVFLCLAGVAGALFWRGWRYELEARRFHTLQEHVFREAFPGQPVPRGILTRLQSEFAEARAVSGDSGQLPVVESAHDHLLKVLHGLPDGLRMKWTKIDVQGAELSLTGNVRSFGDTSVIESALRTQGFSVTTGRRDQLADGTVSVDLQVLQSPTKQAAVSGDRPQ